ncbi:MAG TPA: monovalent cation/H(+) antiporter subunit G [Casimicrobiaceae bacterium]|jgi:multicomponent K+:H+ antiporter subunit G
MSAGLSLWVALPVALLAVGGATIALLGSIGLLRLPTFYQRVHPPTMGTTAGTILVLLASTILFSALEGGLALREIVIAAFMVVSTPVTFMLLVRAALHRDRKGAHEDVE